MLDRNHTIPELILSIIISTLVSIFASLILNQQIYDDILLITFCFIVASCHYSLLKSVQPDSSSPTHGFNSLTALSRPVYFCLLCTSILLLRLATKPHNQQILTAIFKQLTLYNFHLTFGHCTLFCNFLEVSLLFFPIVFTLGLCPQISTFTLCVIEQIDMFVFGGTAMNNLPGAFLSIIRSLISTALLSITLLAALHTIPENLDGQLSKSVVFSIFCALCVLFAYFTSRQTSDLLLYAHAFKDLVVEKCLLTRCVSCVEEEEPVVVLEKVVTAENVTKDVKSVYLSVPDSSVESSQSNSLASSFASVNKDDNKEKELDVEEAHANQDNQEQDY